MTHDSFVGSTAEEAMKKAIEAYGDDVMLIKTSQIKAKSPTQEPMFEVTVATEKPLQKQKKAQPQINSKIKAYKNTPKFSIDELKAKEEKDDGVINLISKAYEQANQFNNINKSNLDEEVNQKIENVSKQISSIKEQIKILSDMTWDGLLTQRGGLVIPPEFATIYKISKESGMKEAHLNDIMTSTITNMPSMMKTNPSAVKRYFYLFLRNMLPSRKTRHNNRQKIMILVGPTGVGKTTTLSKLAARFAYSGEKRYKTGIITLDTYRMGAVEQLRQYAQIMKLPFITVFEENDFASAIKSLNYCDIILIDTMGSSQYDKEKLAKIDSFLRSSGVDVDVNLVLSATAKIDDLLDTYNGFSFLNIDTLIITKFDETRIFGNVFSLLYETRTPASYLGIGQEVPDDILEADSEFLAQCVLDGFNKENNDGSSN